MFSSHTFGCKVLRPWADWAAVRMQRHKGRRSRASFGLWASAGPTAIKQNQSLCKWDEWDAAALICLRHSPSVGPPNVFSSPSSKQQAPARRSGHVVAGFGSALMDGKSPAALFYFVSRCAWKMERHRFTEPPIPAVLESVLIGQKVHHHAVELILSLRKWK